MIFRVTMWGKGNTEHKELYFEGNPNTFCEKLKCLFKDKDWKISFITVNESIVLLDEIEVVR